MGVSVTHVDPVSKSPHRLRTINNAPPSYELQSQQHKEYNVSRDEHLEKRAFRQWPDTLPRQVWRPDQRPDRRSER